MDHLVANTPLDNKIKTLVLPTIEQLGFELVRIRYFDKDKATLQIMLDKNNKGIEIAECATISINISAILDVNDPIDNEYNFVTGSVGLARTYKNNTEDSQFFIILQNEPLFEGEYTPVGKVIYGLEILKKIKHQRHSEYILRPDFINSFKMLR